MSLFFGGMRPQLQYRKRKRVRKARSSRQKSTYPLRIPPNKDFHFKILSLSQKLNFKVLSLSGVRHNQRISNKNKNEVNTKEYVD